MAEPPGEIEWLDLGPPERPRAPRRRLLDPRVLGGLLLVVLAAVGLTFVMVHGHRGNHPAATRGSVSATPSSASPSLAADAPTVVATLPSTSAQLPRTTVVGHPLLGATDGWELFSRGSDYLTRVEMAAGRVIVTPVPELQTGGSVAFLVGPHAALVRPSDFVTGYLVPDGAPARLLAGALSDGGAAFPGPASGQYWSESANSAAADGLRLYLVDGTGRRLGPAIALPPTTNTPVVSDGSGYVITQGIGGSYDARPGSLRRITTGAVVAVGPTAWLAEECDDVGECSNVLIDKATWTSQVIGPTTSPVGFSPGVVSPDASRAVLLRPNGRGGLRLIMLQVATGTERVVADVPDSSFGDQVVAFSPDGRWLFVVGLGGALDVYDTATLRQVALGVKLPPVEQVAVRPAE